MQQIYIHTYIKYESFYLLDGTCSSPTSYFAPSAVAKQHKKQLLKNKTTRLAARDAKVIETKTVAEIDAEIRNLQRPYKKNEDNIMPHAIRSKIDRLNKERKLLQQELESKPVAAAASNTKTTTFVPLERPQVSIYYDAVMNPYGEPPPGQPRLYHRKPSLGGGVTRTLMEAWVPGEPEFIPPPPPPPPPPPRHAPPQQRNAQIKVNKADASSQRPAHKPTNQQQRSSRTDDKQPSVEKAKTETKQQEPPEEPKQPAPIISKYLVDPTQLPEMPEASASVRRRGLKHDIWASSDEVDYEATVGSFVGLDGSVAVERSDYYYIDASGSTQGPFPEANMRQWTSAGFFSGETLIRTSKSKHFTKLGQCSALASALPEKQKQNQAKDDLKDDSGLESRIAMLKQENDDAEEDDTVEARIARLKGNHPQQIDTDAEDREEDSIEARTARLKDGPSKMHMNNELEDDHRNEERVASRQHEEPCNDKQDEVDDSFETRIAVLKKDHSAELRNDDDDNTSVVDEHDLVARPVKSAEGGHEQTMFKAPEGAFAATYTDNDTDETTAYPYPVGDADELPAYPIDEDDFEVAPYPLHDAEYPVTDEYPATDDYPATDAYPISDPYPDAGATDNRNSVEESHREPPKKKIKADKDVVAFIPSHLHRRKAKK
ncbi:hypothetical protein MPSEU_000854900 [Mayamaea pseudoterrestris]|nr:hypothetical protein MPSEU_000854900 [Mayamaea pseudoterrestris]